MKNTYKKKYSKTMTAEQELKDLTKKKGITPYKLGKDIGIDQGALSRYFNGKREMTANTYLKIKSYLDKL